MSESIPLELQQAMALHQADRLAEAETICRGFLRAHKRDRDATHLLAMLTHQKGDTQAALLALDRLLRAHPNFAPAVNTRGRMLIAIGRHREALAAFDRAIAINPDYAIAWLNRAQTLATLQQHAAALASYDRAIAVGPEYAQFHYGKGNSLYEIGQIADARASYDRAIAIEPNFPMALNNRALTLERLGLIEEALGDYARAVELSPASSDCWNNQGVLLDRIGRYDEAIASFRRAIALHPNARGPILNLADTFYVTGRRQEAVATVNRCLAIDPADMRARVDHMIYQLPILYDTEGEISERRRAYEAELRALSAAVEAAPEPARFAGAVGSSQPFYLAYQAQSNVELQRLYGGLMCRILASRYPNAPVPHPPIPDARIRVGLVSGFFRQHPVWRCLLQGWVTQLDRQRFSVFGYHTASVQDSETEVCSALCESFVQGPLGVLAWRERITADAPHVLLYPEVGMDGTAAILAAQRLAPVQCMSWGHPDTSGLPTMDYFLSSAEMEPDGGEAHYTEQLVCLPSLGTYYEPRTVEAVALSRAEMGLPPDVPAFWCGQSLYKYLPQHDEVFPRIARELGDCRFVFIEYPRGTAVTEQFRHRLRRAFVAFGLDAEKHCVILPRLTGDQYVAAAGQCDVVLDSIGWSGFNTNVEALDHNKPIVTFAGSLMRGRHSTAVLRVMEIPEAIVDTVGDYIAIAVALGRDPAARAAMERRITDAKHRVYRDRAPIAALEDFLERAVRSPA